MFHMYINIYMSCMRVGVGIALQGLITQRMYFEGVSVTTVILATVRGEGRLRAAGRYIVSGESGESGGSGGVFHFAHF